MIAQLDGVSVHRQGRLDLAPVDLTLEPGTATAVVGGDGAGKTTLLRVLVGTTTPSTGQVTTPPRRRLGYVAATSGTWPDLTVVENLVLCGTAYGLARDDLRDRIDELVTVTGLQAARDRLAGHLSGGMRQKLAFACATLHRPDLLVLDEPTTGVDPVSRAELWRLISTSLAAGTAAVFSTTDLDEAERADHVLVLDAGRVVAAGTPDQVAARLPRGTSHRHGDRRSTDPHGDDLLAVTDLYVRFGGTTAVDGVSLHVAPGEVVGLLGANGAGKTTTIRAALGLQRPSAGTVALLGAAPTRRARRGVGYVPQTLGLWHDLSVRENLEFVAGAFGAPLPTLERDLWDLRDKLVGDLPLGQQRRIAFTAGLGHDPRLLVLDEPTSGVGPAERAELWDRIHATRDTGTGVLVTTHHMGEAAHCDRIVAMADGRVAVSGTLDDLLADRWAVAVGTADWAEAFARLDRRFDAVALRGRQVRVPDASVEAVEAALDGLAARVDRVPADFDEVFVTLGRGS